jgi:DHA3 family tetracycline resistance protein-like MFS transporter
MRLPAFTAPLGVRDFRLLLVGQTISAIGNYVFLVAVPFQLLSLGASPLELGVAVTILVGATLVFLLIGGAQADRHSRRRLILANDVVGAATTAVLAALAFSSRLEIWHLYVASGLLGAAFAFQVPAVESIVVELVPSDLLIQGNAARSIFASVARAIGPLLGGVIMVASGAAAAFATDALTFALSFALFFLAKATPRPASVDARFLRHVREGLAFVAAQRWLWLAAAGFGLLNLSGGGLRGVMAPLFVLDELHGDAATYGLVTAANGIGQIVGGIVIAQLSFARPGTALWLFEIVAGLSLGLVGVVVWLPFTVVAIGAMGVALSCSDALYKTMLQRNVPAEMLGRVSSINVLVTGLLVPVAPLVAGALILAAGAAETFVIAGAFAAGLSVILLVVSPMRSLR